MHSLLQQKNKLSLHSQPVKSQRREQQPMAQMGDNYVCPKMEDLQPHHAGPIMQGSDLQEIRKTRILF